MPAEPRDLDQVVSLRLPSGVAAALRDKANAQGCTVSDLLRSAAFGLAGRKPIGWQCQHMNITSGAVLGKPTGWCGCDLRPVYSTRELRPAPTAGACT